MARKKENTFLLVSLEEEKAKKLAKVINNEVCRKILDLLSQGNLTETDIAERLGIPLSTAHYNLQQLVESGLVSADEYHYSEKGKEVNHYSLANKYVVIAPKVTESLAQKLKKVLPVIGITVIATGILQLVGRQPMQITKAISQVSPPMLAENLEVGKGAAMAFLRNATNTTALNATNTITMVQYSQYFNPALWFLAGAIAAVVLFLIVEIVREKINK